MLRNVSLLSIAALLTACGGGGSGASTAATAPTIDTRASASLTPAVGDFYSYKGFDTSTGASPPTSAPYWYTTVVTAVETNGAWTETSVQDSPPAPYTQQHFLADGVNDSRAESGCTRNFQSTYSTKQRELVVGASWTRTIVGTVMGNHCPISSLTSGTVITTVLALETVTVPAGTFKTAKVSIRGSYKYATGSAMVEESTNWLDTDSRRLIKTSGTQSYTSTTGDVTLSSDAAELQGYAQAATGRRLLNVQRFAGDWTGSFAGPDSGTCIGQVSPDGVLDASCAGGLFTIHGLIDADGNVTYSLSAGGSTGPSFSGKFDSPLSVHGTWSRPGGGTGTWQLTHE